MLQPTDLPGVSCFPIARSNLAWTSIFLKWASLNLVNAYYCYQAIRLLVQHYSVHAFTQFRNHTYGLIVD
ncbi:hypothetical protein D0T21_20635 [Duganella sp. BJB476]|nr:hypothetical protein D0T21_20635 [Duganella sp. BJB476]